MRRCIEASGRAGGDNLCETFSPCLHAHACTQSTCTRMHACTPTPTPKWGILTHTHTRGVYPHTKGVYTHTQTAGRQAPTHCESRSALTMSQKGALLLLSGAAPHTPSACKPRHAHSRGRPLVTHSRGRPLVTSQQGQASCDTAAGASILRNSAQMIL